jgi:ferritin-like metal-binding protein YciE
MTIASLEQLLQEELRDIYDAEKQLVKALPKMAKAAGSQELKEAIQEHLEVTKGQVQRLEEIFTSMGTKAQSKPCAGMKGLIQEGEEKIEQKAADPFHDAGLIGAAQRVEHYEIAAYGTARAMAERPGLDEVAELLQETITEEEEADETLTEVAEKLLMDVSGEGESEEEEAATPARSSSPKVKRSAGR